MKKVQNPMEAQLPEVAMEALGFSELANVYGGEDVVPVVGKNIGFGCKCEAPPSKPVE